MTEPNDFKALREGLHLTQAEAAAEIGVSVRTWLGWERGEHKPSKMAQPAIERLRKRAEKAKAKS